MPIKKINKINHNLFTALELVLLSSHLQIVTDIIVIFMFQNHEFPGQTELSPGLRGCSQQADQPGAVCLLRLLVYGKSNPWCAVRLKGLLKDS